MSNCWGSVSDLAHDWPVEGVAAAYYSVEEVRAASILLSDDAWERISGTFGPSREAVEFQSLVLIRNRFLGDEVLVNTLRARRPTLAVPPEPGSGDSCRWCDPASSVHPRNPGAEREHFTSAIPYNPRVCSRPNLARGAPISGIVLGDESMHDYLALDERQFEELVVAADEYVRAAHARMLADYFVIALNGGPKSASSVAHAHLQVVGRRSRHFAYPERIVHSCPPDYWYDAGTAHERMGLGVATDPYRVADALTGGCLQEA